MKIRMNIEDCTLLKGVDKSRSGIYLIKFLVVLKIWEWI